MQNTPHTLSLAACLVELKPQSSEVQLFPAGTFSAPDGALQGKGPWYLDASNAQQLIAALGQQHHILIDYDHQSLLFTKNKLPLAAAGTFSGAALEWRDGKGLFATGVQWTAAASEKIKDGAYRFISPLFTYNSDTGAVQNLISIAVTDNPAIKNMQAIELAAASFLNPPHKNIMNKELLALLGLDNTADDAAVLAAATALKTATTQPAELLAALSLTESATQDDVLAAVKKLQTDKDALAAAQQAAPDASKFVPIEAVTELQTQLAALSQQIESDNIAQLITANQAKLPTPALREWAKEQSLAALTAYLEKAPEVAALKGMQSDGADRAPAEGDAQSLVAAANQYQADMAAAGNPVDDVTAINHVKGAQ